MTQDAATLAEPTDQPVRTGGLTRRATVPLVAAAVGASGYLLAACGDSSDDDTSNGSATASAAPTTAGATAGSTGSAGGTGPAANSLAAVNDIPDGGGVILKDQKIVLTRAGQDVHAFSAVCTHQGCLVGTVAGGTINCPCHGSKFNATTGTVVNGPAASPLSPVSITVQDGGVFKS